MHVGTGMCRGVLSDLQSSKRWVYYEKWDERLFIKGFDTFKFRHFQI